MKLLYFMPEGLVAECFGEEAGGLDCIQLAGRFSHLLSLSYELRKGAVGERGHRL